LISAVDIGNHGSAFIEILVGRSGCSDEDYKVYYACRVKIIVSFTIKVVLVY